jgi:hypothetical protein
MPPFCHRQFRPQALIKGRTNPSLPQTLDYYMSEHTLMQALLFASAKYFPQAQQLMLRRP